MELLFNSVYLCNFYFMGYVNLIHCKSVPSYILVKSVSEQFQQFTFNVLYSQHLHKFNLYLHKFKVLQRGIPITARR